MAAFTARSAACSAATSCSSLTGRSGGCAAPPRGWLPTRPRWPVAGRARDLPRAGGPVSMVAAASSAAASAASAVAGAGGWAGVPAADGCGPGASGVAGSGVAGAPAGTMRRARSAARWAWCWPSSGVRVPARDGEAAHRRAVPGDHHLLRADRLMEHAHLAGWFRRGAERSHALAPGRQQRHRRGARGQHAAPSQICPHRSSSPRSPGASRERRGSAGPPGPRHPGARAPGTPPGAPGAACRAAERGARAG